VTHEHYDYRAIADLLEWERNHGLWYCRFVGM